MCSRFKSHHIALQQYTTFHCSQGGCSKSRMRNLTPSATAAVTHIDWCPLCKPGQATHPDVQVAYLCVPKDLYQAGGRVSAYVGMTIWCQDKVTVCWATDISVAVL